jgi:hypothetical protein
MNTVVHEAVISGDCEDPQLYAAAPIYEWERSEAGQWIMAHSLVVPYFQILTDMNTINYKLRIVADLKEQDITYFKLKWGEFK